MTSAAMTGRRDRPQPGEDNWEPTGLARPGYLLAIGLFSVGRKGKDYLVTHPRVRHRLGSGPVMLAIAMTAWTVAGSVTLLTGQGLFLAVLYAAAAGLCTAMTVLAFLFRALFDTTSPARADQVQR